LIKPEDHVATIERAGQHTQQNTGPDYLVLPFILYNMPPEARELFAKGLPPILTERLVPVDWKDQWAPMKPFLLE
jgi:hypothetical protein